MMNSRFDHIDHYFELAEATTRDFFSRKNAIENFKQLGFPGKKNEDWKYINLNELLHEAYTFFHFNERLSAMWQSVTQDFYYLHFHNGQYDTARSYLPKEIIVDTLHHRLEQKDKFVMETLGTLAKTNVPGFTAMNTVLFTDGLLIHIPLNVHLDKPLFIINSANTSEKVMLQTRHLIHVEPRANAHIVECFVGEGEYWRNHITECWLQAEAQLQYSKSQQEDINAQHTHFIAAKVHEQSVFKSFSLDTGSSLARTDIETQLIDKESAAEYYGVYLGRSQQTIDYHTVINHHSPYTRSAEHYKGILTERGHGVFNGRIFVAAHAQKIISEQKNDNLLLSKNAEIDTKPELEIYADDVQCSHGTTVGQLNENAVFYLVSRGIEPMEAKKILTYGFANELLSNIHETVTQEYFEKQLQSWFSDGI